jgi:glycogen operon protein
MGSKFSFGENATGYPELSFHSLKPWEFDENASELVFAYMYAEDKEKYRVKKDAFIYETFFQTS